MQLSRLVSEKEGYDSQGTSVYMLLSILTLASEAIIHSTILEEISEPNSQKTRSLTRMMVEGKARPETATSNTLTANRGFYFSFIKVLLGRKILTMAPHCHQFTCIHQSRLQRESIHWQMSAFLHILLRLWGLCHSALQFFRTPGSPITPRLRLQQQSRGKAVFHHTSSS